MRAVPDLRYDLRAHLHFHFLPRSSHLYFLFVLAPAFTFVSFRSSSAIQAQHHASLPTC